MIIDDYIGCYKELKQYSIDATYEDIVNPVDGVIYPGICKEIPENIRESVLGGIELIFARPPINPIMFLRKTSKGTHCPHQAHTDNIMGSYSLMLYLTDNEDAGTSLLVHKETGMTMAPENEKYLDILIADQNNSDKWKVLDIAKAKQNRAFIFDAAMIHRAEPVGGFGLTNEDSRIVLTCFFS